MELLLWVPKDVVRDRVMPFLDLASVWKFDLASRFVPQDFWTQVVRPQLYEGVIVTEKVVYNSNVVSWLFLRHMHVKVLEFPKRVIDWDIHWAEQVLTRVNFIDLEGCNMVSNKKVSNLFRICGSLNGVNLGGCSWLVDETLFVLADRHVDLTYLNLSDVSLITDTAIQNIVARCRKLTEVIIDDCDQLGDASILALSRCELSRVSFDNCEAVSEAAITSLIAATGGTLVSINMAYNRNVGDMTLQTLAHNSPHLKELDVSECRGIRAAGYVAIFHNSRNLQKLSMESCDVPFPELITVCANISVNLLHLNLSGSDTLNDVHIELVASRATKLNVLLLSESSIISNNALLSIARHLPYLYELQVGHCPLLSYDGFARLFHSCRKLMFFDVSYTRFGDACLRVLAKQCLSLDDLLIDGTYITDAGIAHLARHSAKFTRVGIGATAVTETALANLIVNCLKLSYINYQERMSVSDTLLELVKRRKIELKLGTGEGFFV